ncbi:YebC/PmpR family DNA-binding transcriptional regulator [Lentisphaera profundi]|uniref:Probable transcriptional regulatory protein PQO03_06270 n=1 Tax=Lentisphaera profundi TaxID=1658616 RepID=A0ABY7VPU5_9BACT|nr:YebC/PmpR family DNA-binding transcriptional regulator [Lentisphaera profundi]WDE95324.1 YebC/PmpR family DNA-binding transcriptional regulator [Lentisphaera profundi]
MGRTFENRKHSMAKTGAMKIKLYTKFAKEIYVCAKNMSADPDHNPLLRRVIDKAKKSSVPSHVIENALKKAKGGGGEDYLPARYEGYGPGGCMVIVDCLTDNSNRTISEVRNCFTKCDCKLGGPGSVAHMFEHQAIFAFKGDDDEVVLETLMMADIDVTDVTVEEGIVTVFAPHTEFYKVKTTLTEENADIHFEVEEITFEPQAMHAVGKEDEARFEKFINMLNDCDDVQEIYHNAELED